MNQKKKRRQKQITSEIAHCGKSTPLPAKRLEFRWEQSRKRVTADISEVGLKVGFTSSKEKKRREDKIEHSICFF